MAEILGLGVSHYPAFSGTDENMANIFRYRLKDPALPDHLRAPENWPDAIKREMGEDNGASAAAHHRARMLEGTRECMKALREFNPDFCIIFGDDQYENFREDIIPPYCVLAYDDMTVRPWGQLQESGELTDKPNYWGETKEFELDVKFATQFAKEMTQKLLESEFDVSYAYTPNNHPGLGHSFLNALLYLDYDREGWDWPIIPMQINCYGSRVISFKGFLTSIADNALPADPPSPMPNRCFRLGAQIAKICNESPYRVALIASSSWSHAFLNDETYRMLPAIDFDKQMYAALQQNDYEHWRTRKLDELVKTGNQEMLNWMTLLGAMSETGQTLTWSDFVETALFNSSKVAAIYKP